MRVCPSVRPSVGRSVRPSVGPSVTLSLKTGKSMILIANNDVSCNHIIIQSFHHHEDASLALWALFLFVCVFSAEPLSLAVAKRLRGNKAHKANDAS